MLCTVSSVTFDPAGVVELRLVSPVDPSETKRRVNRIATLDGGVVLNDFGYSDADRTLTLRWQPTSQAQHLAISQLVQLYPRLVVSTTGGVYLAAPDVYQQGTDESSLRLLVIEKLSA